MLHENYLTKIVNKPNLELDYSEFERMIGLRTGCEAVKNCTDTRNQGSE